MYCNVDLSWYRYELWFIELEILDSIMFIL